MQESILKDKSDKKIVVKKEEDVTINKVVIKRRNFEGFVEDDDDCMLVEMLARMKRPHRAVIRDLWSDTALRLGNPGSSVQNPIVIE